MNLLLAVLGILLAIVLGAVLVTLLVVLLSIRSLRRRNRVSPDAATDAPLTWLVSATSPARLHRRLRSAVAVSRVIHARHAADPSTGQVGGMAAELERQAIALDHHLTVVARLAPSERRRLMPDLTAQTTQIEQLVGRLSRADAQSSAPATLPGQRSAIEDLAEQLDHFEAAHHEVDRAERGAGLGPAPTMPPRATQPQPEPDSPGPQRATG